MCTQYPWYFYFLVESLLIATAYHGVHLYDYATISKPWRHLIQKRKAQGIELEGASVFLQALIQFFFRSLVWYFHISHSSTYKVDSISLLSFILKLIIYDGISTVLHRYQHSIHGRFSNHLKHHQLRTPTTASSAYTSIGELILSNHIGWIIVGFIPGSFWDQSFFLAISSGWKMLSHSNYDHPWEQMKLFRLLKLVGSHEHHVHHLIPHRNFADLFIFWDQLFGTFLDPEEVDGIYSRNHNKYKVKNEKDGIVD